MAEHPETQDDPLAERAFQDALRAILAEHGRFELELARPERGGWTPRCPRARG